VATIANRFSAARRITDFCSIYCASMLANARSLRQGQNGVVQGLHADANTLGPAGRP
jgi:hypothetical protein